MSDHAVQSRVGHDLINREIVRGLRMGGTLKVLLVTAVIAGGFGWVAAKQRFDEKQRERAEIERQTATAEQRGIAEVCSAAVMNADEVEIVDLPEISGRPGVEKTIRRFRDPS